jgi:GNAT superfamily N-acetyltransferase
MTPVLSEPPVLFRPMSQRDSAAELTSLLHAAYRKQVDMGLRPLAGRQTADVTARRVSSGECIVSEAGGQLVGMIVLNEREEAEFPPTFQRPDVAHFSLFAVAPDFQGRGVGAGLLKAVERRAHELGFEHLALSMAEPDTELLQYYLKRGFDYAERWQWPYTNYVSAILIKRLGEGSAKSQAPARPA